MASLWCVLFGFDVGSRVVVWSEFVVGVDSEGCRVIVCVSRRVSESGCVCSV